MSGTVIARAYAYAAVLTYAMPRTGIRGHVPMVLRMCYAMSAGCYHPTGSYAMSGTDLTYAATGTDLRYAPTRLLMKRARRRGSTIATALWPYAYALCTDMLCPYAYALRIVRTKSGYDTTGFSYGISGTQVGYGTTCFATACALYDGRAYEPPHMALPRYISLDPRP
eukprot:3940257-Rhodomonas_salina.3